jgi:uncharacterized protein (DUF697 family)
MKDEHATPPEAVLSDAEIAAQIRRYCDRAPAAGIRFLPKVNVPALKVVRRALPEQAAARALAAAFAAAVRLTPAAPVLAQAGTGDLSRLSYRPAGEAHALAKGFIRRQRWIAAGTGAAFGFAGAAGLIADAPALVVLSLATVIRIGQCHGEGPSPALAAAVFALASADSTDEKASAWQAALASKAQEISTGSDDAALRDGLERAAERQFAKAALSSSLQRLSHTLLQRMGTRKLASTLPVIGSIAGGIVNAQFVRQLAEAAQMVFSARQLQRQGVRVPLPPRLAKIPA